MGDESCDPVIIHVETLIVGSGPLGCTFARKLVDGGRQVFMIDVGAQLSPRPGWNWRNQYAYQRDPTLFPEVYRGTMYPLSIASDRKTQPTLPPEAFKVDFDKHERFVCVGQNPDQDSGDNIPMAVATYAVGGMGTHWTCHVPREHPLMERSNLLTNDEWEELYSESERLMKKSNIDLFPSIRNTVVKEALRKAYPELSPPYHPQNLPVAAERADEESEFVTWTGSDTILGDHLIKMIEKGDDRMVLKEMWQCIKLGIAKSGDKIEFAIVKDFKTGTLYHIHAQVFVIAAGACLIPQILFNSGIRPAALGHYLCDHPFAACQIILQKSIVDAIPNDPRWKNQVAQHQKEHPYDPIPIPLGDPDPRCWIPVSEDHPWHCQILFDAKFPITQNVDRRLVVDLLWYGSVQPRFENCITFSENVKDIYNMPQPTFHYQLTEEEHAKSKEMIEDMWKAANALGSILPGSEPQFFPPGHSLHTLGTCRMGQTTEDSVVDTYSRVWQFSNLYLGSCGVIPTGTACNPTNAAIALAIRASNKILEAFRTGRLQKTKITSRL